MANACAATTKALCHEDPAEYYYVPRGNGGGGGGAGARVGTAPVAISPAMAPATPLSGGSYGSPLDTTSPPSYMLGYATGGPSPPPPMSHAHGRVMSSDALAELAVLRDRAVAEACRDGIWQARLGRRRAPHGAPAPVGVAGGEELIFGAPDGLDDGMLSAFHAAALDVPGEGMSASMEAALADAAASYTAAAREGGFRDGPGTGAARAGAQITVLEGAPTAQAPYDLVLCDAPCSGSGAWRRAPEGKWTLTADDLAALNDTQDAILDAAATLVVTGGTLAYAT